MPPPSATGATGNADAWRARGRIAAAMLAGLTPFLILQSLIPVIPNGLDVWLASLLPVVGVAGSAGALVALSYLRPGPRISGLVRALERAGVAAYGAGLALDLLLLAGVGPRRAPDLGFVNVVNFVEWLVISPLVWLTLRGGRQRPADG